MKLSASECGEGRERERLADFCKVSLCVIGQDRSKSENCILFSKEKRWDLIRR